MLRGEGEQGERIVLLLPRVAFTLAVAICDTRDENSFEHRPSRPAGRGAECRDIPNGLRSRRGSWRYRPRSARRARRRVIPTPRAKMSVRGPPGARAPPL